MGMAKKKKKLKDVDYSLFNNYKSLGVAIVRQAVEDMQDDLKKNREIERKRILEPYRRFFFSDYCTILIDSSGPAIYYKALDNFYTYGNVYGLSKKPERNKAFKEKEAAIDIEKYWNSMEGVV